MNNISGSILLGFSVLALSHIFMMTDLIQQIDPGQDKGYVVNYTIQNVPIILWLFTGFSFVYALKLLFYKK